MFVRFWEDEKDEDVSGFAASGDLAVSMLLAVVGLSRGRRRWR